MPLVFWRSWDYRNSWHLSVMKFLFSYNWVTWVRAKDIQRSFVSPKSSLSNMPVIRHGDIWLHDKSLGIWYFILPLSIFVDAKGFIPQSALTAYAQPQSPPPSYNSVVGNLQPSSPSLKSRRPTTPVNFSPHSGRSTPTQNSPRHSITSTDGAGVTYNPQNSSYQQPSQQQTQQEHGAAAKKQFEVCILTIVF